MNDTELREYMTELFGMEPERFYDLWKRLADVKENKDRASYLIQEYGKNAVIVAMLNEGLLVVSKP